MSSETSSRCEWCAPEFSCWDGSARCCKVSSETIHERRYNSAHTWCGLSFYAEPLVVCAEGLDVTCAQCIAERAVSSETSSDIKERLRTTLDVVHGMLGECWATKDIEGAIASIQTLEAENVRIADLNKRHREEMVYWRDQAHALQADQIDARLVQLARWIERHGDNVKDGACEFCYPGNELGDGKFICARHVASQIMLDHDAALRDQSEESATNE